LAGELFTKLWGDRRFPEWVAAQNSSGFPGIGLPAYLADTLLIYNADTVSIAAKDALRKIVFFLRGGARRCGGFQSTAATVTE